MIVTMLCSLQILNFWFGLFVSWICVYSDIVDTVYLTLCQLFLQATLGHVFFSFTGFPFIIYENKIPVSKDILHWTFLQGHTYIFTRTFTFTFYFLHY